MALTKKEITEEKPWDEFILVHAPQALFQSWKWGEVEKKLGHTIWRWGWFEKNILVGVAQIKKISARRGTFLHVRHGPIGDVDFEDLKKLARAENAWFIRISPQVKEDSMYKKLGFVPAPIHAMDAEVCWVLDLDKREEELLAGMRKTTRYEIRRAQKMGVTVVKSTDLKEFFTLYDETSRRQKFVQHTGIAEEYEVFHPELYLASLDGSTIAAAIIVYFDNEAIYHHGASIPGKIPGSHLVQWKAILEAKKRGKKLYNFWGIAPDEKPNHPWQGLTVFKKGFGGREIRYIHALDFPVSPWYIIPKTIEHIRKKMKGY